MNYVQEELLRQERVLTVLLSGQRTARREEAPPEQAEADPGSTAARETDAPLRAAARAGTQRAGDQAASRADPAEADGTPEGGTAGGSPGRETLARRTGGRAGRGTPAAAWGSGIPQPGVPGRRGTASGGFPEAGGVSAEALSQAIQRDARRYDGGFTLY